MILMLISDNSKTETRSIVRYTKDFAGKRTEEMWKMRTCDNVGELEQAVAEKIKANIICVDITMAGALELTVKLRQLSPLAYIILIASPKISPLTYMRPIIGAESLMLKPLTDLQIHKVLQEALGTYIKRFLQSDEKKAFVIENRGGKELIAYENIYFFEAREKRVYLNTDTEEYGFYDTLDALEERLSEGFIRCHRSFLVNKQKIAKVFLSQNRLVLQEDFEIPLSRSYKQSIKEYLAGEGRTRE